MQGLKTRNIPSFESWRDTNTEFDINKLRQRGFILEMIDSELPSNSLNQIALKKIVLISNESNIYVKSRNVSRLFPKGSYEKK